MSRPAVIEIVIGATTVRVSGAPRRETSKPCCAQFGARPHNGAMLVPPAPIRVPVATKPVDFRKVSTLAFWVGYAVAELMPLYQLLKANLLTSAKLAVMRRQCRCSIPGAVRLRPAISGRSHTMIGPVAEETRRPWSIATRRVAAASISAGKSLWHRAVRRLWAVTRSCRRTGSPSRFAERKCPEFFAHLVWAERRPALA
jgi:hypothetical protein